jgi:HK97 family phage major capsid protein
MQDRVRPEFHPEVFKMSLTLTELKQGAKAALEAANAVVTAAEQRGGNMTKAESETYDAKMAEFKSLNGKAAVIEKKNTIRAFFRNGTPEPMLLGGGPLDEQPLGFMGPHSVPPSSAETRSPEYKASLLSFLRTGGRAHNDDLTIGADGMGGYVIPGSDAYTRQRKANGSFLPTMNAASYEGSPDGSSLATGGAAVSVPTDQLVVALALPDIGIFDASLVIPTTTAIKIPVQTAFGTSALKAESGASVYSFGGTDPTLGQFELDAYMVGALRVVSWELLQDVQMFQQFVVDDLLKGQRIIEDQLLASGTGVSQPTGVFGNTGTGTGSAYELVGSSADSTTLLNSLFDVTSTLKGAYQANASWIMSRATALTIRRSQMQQNLFAPVATVDADGTERILGRPVNFDVNAPALPTATTAGVVPILFGDFKQGYIVGVRGGSGINVKILDQPLAAQGQLGILAYRRIDGKVRRSEAIQAITISHS